MNSTMVGKGNYVNIIIVAFYISNLYALLCKPQGTMCVIFVFKCMNSTKCKNMKNITKNFTQLQDDPLFIFIMS